MIQHGGNKTEMNNQKRVAVVVMAILMIGSAINVYMIANPTRSFNVIANQEQQRVDNNSQESVIKADIQIQINSQQSIKDIQAEDKNKQTQVQQQEDTEIDLAIAQKSKQKEDDKQQQNSVQFIKQINKEELTEQQISGNAELRTRMQRPKPAQRKIRIWGIASPVRSHICSITNAVNILTPVSMKTIFKLIQKGKLGGVLIITDRLDTFAEQLILASIKLIENSVVKYYDVQPDADYKFIEAPLRHHKCQQIVYMGHNFEIGSQQAATIASLAQSISDYKVLFSQYAQIGKKSTKLADLSRSDLHGLHGQQFNKYVYIFNIQYYRLVCPLNFAYYGKFTIQQMLILPIVAVSQKMQTLSSFSQVVHALNESIVQLKQFPIHQPSQQPYSLCFVSYPSNPFIQNNTDIIRYLNSIKSMNLTNTNTNNTNSTNMSVSIIIFIPYNKNNRNSIKQIIQQLDGLYKNKNIKRVKVNIRYNKSVSSLSTYQAAYSYCAHKTLMISSRHNVQFNGNFAYKLLQSYSQYYHYYFINYINQNNQYINFTRSPLWDLPYFFRQKSTLFRSHFYALQIYKSDFLKTNYFWTLKSAQLDFYQTQASFTIPLLEMVRLNFYIINQTLFKVHLRNKTQTELRQINNIRKYYQWTQLVDNKLYPFQYNCLLNQAFRRFALDKIPKKIHQVWIGAQISPFRQKLHDTLKMVNSDFEMMLWQKQNITVQNFPLTFSLITRTLQYQKSSQRSYLAPIASLMRYQTLYNWGGIYFDFKTEGLKPMNPFLKYQIFFTDAAVTKLRFGSPDNVGNPMMGATQHNYYLKFVLTQLITQSKIDYNVKKFPAIVGAYILRKSISDQQFFTMAGFGFHLLSPRPETDDVNQCGVFSSFDKDQQVFDVFDERTKTQYRIGIPCKQYPQAYALMYKPLGRTWVAKSN